MATAETGMKHVAVREMDMDMLSDILEVRIRFFVRIRINFILPK